MKSQERREDRREKSQQKRSNADIRPWISVGEAAEIALSKIVKNMQNAREGA